MSYQFYESILNKIDNTAATYINGVLGDVVAQVEPVAWQCFTLYIILWGFANYRGLVQTPIVDAIFRLVKIGMILAFALNVGRYQSLVVTNLTQLPDFLANLAGSALPMDATTPSGILDASLSSFLETGKAIWQVSGLDNMGGYIYAILIWIIGLIVCTYAAFLIALAKIMLSILLAFGPIFIACLIFDGTKRFFEAWLGQVINFAIVAMLTVAVLGFMMSMLAAEAAKMAAVAIADPANVGIFSMATTIIISGMCFLVLMQVTGVAAALGGGVQVSTLGAAAAIARAAGSSASAMRPQNIRRAAMSVRRDVRAVRAGAAPVGALYRRIRGGNSVKQA